MNTLLNKILNIIFISTLSCLALVSGLYLLHRLYFNELSNRNVINDEKYEKYEVKELVKRVGYLKLPPRESSFLNFRGRSKERIRVGVFGDSHTYGDEVSESESYPAHLQRILGPDYQVINFGMSWFSLGQSFILFDEFYKSMSLDYVVFGPRGLYRYRTTSFNHTSDILPYYIHSRFILEDFGSGKDVLVEKKPVGNSFREKFENYYTFFSTSQYIYYDSRTPSFLRPVEFYFNTNLINPFYYHDNPLDEAGDIHSKILERIIARVGNKFLFLHNRFEENELVKKIAWNDSSHLELKSLRWEGFPWVAPKGHPTGFGNALVAARASSFFTGVEYKTSQLEVIGDYSDWDDQTIVASSNDQEIGGLSLKDSSNSHLVGLNCSGQNIGNTLFYPVKKIPERATRLNGFERVYDGSNLTIFTGRDCLVDYSSNELLIEQHFDEKEIVLGSRVLASKRKESYVNGRTMSVYEFNENVGRILVRDSHGSDVLSGDEIIINLR